jgi:hypothetical protein
MSEPRDPAAPEPLQRRSYPAALVRQHPAVLRNENKQLLFAIACPAGAVHSGRLEVSRWPEMPLPLPREMDPVSAASRVVLRDGYDDCRPVLDPDPGANVWAMPGIGRSSRGPTSTTEVGVHAWERRDRGDGTTGSPRGRVARRRG